MLDAAERMFVVHGFHAVSVDDLGAAAGITGPGLYRHFASKDAILMAVLDRVWERLAPAVTEAEHLDPYPALERLLVAHLDLAIERPAALQLLFRELERLPAEYRELARRNHQRYVTAWTTALAGTRADLDGAAARVIALAVHGLLDSAALRGDVQPDGVTTASRRALLEAAARRVLAV
ncbi:MAG: TetR/AcrR family transcriptional regulator [Nitriliruptoraceae bacterium]